MVDKDRIITPIDIQIFQENGIKIENKNTAVSKFFGAMDADSENTVDTSSKTGSTWIKTDPDLDGYFTLTLSTDSKLALTSTSGLILDSIGGNLFDSTLVFLINMLHIYSILTGFSIHHTLIRNITFIDFEYFFVVTCFLTQIFSKTIHS